MEQVESAIAPGYTGEAWGKALWRERKRLKLNQTQLAAKVGTSQQNIGHWEAGRTLPRADSHEKLIALMGRDSPIATLPSKAELSSQAKVSSSATGTLSNSRANPPRQGGLIYGGLDTESSGKNGVDRKRRVNFVSVNEMITAPKDHGTPHLALQAGDGSDVVFVNVREQSPPLADKERGMEWPDAPTDNTRGADWERQLVTSLPSDLRRFVEPQIRWKDITYRLEYLSPRFCIVVKRITGNRLDFTARIGMQQLQVYRKVLENLGEAKMHSGRTFCLILCLDSFSAFNLRTSSKMSTEASLLGIKLLVCNSAKAVVGTIAGLEAGKDAGAYDEEEEEE